MTVKLFDPFSIRGLELKNRILMAPMCMYVCEKEDGIVTDWHLHHYAARAVGQVGLLIVEATGVVPNGRITSKDLGLWSDDHIEGMSKLAKTIKDNGSVAGIQLGHAGRKCEVPGEIHAPSKIAFSDKYQMPTELTISEIKEIVAAFASAAVRAQKAGFEVLEIHAAHGYLLTQFLSPMSNKRTDAYGGSLENRFRIIKEVIEAVRAEYDGVLFVRISATEYHEEAFTAEDSVVISKWMKELDVDLVDVSTGGNILVKINSFPGYQVPYSGKIRNEAQIATGAVGQITTGIQAEEILQNEQADLILIGRELLRDPYWPRTAAKELNIKIEVPAPYFRGWV